MCSADPAPSPPVRDIGLFNCGSPGPPYSDLDDTPANGVIYSLYVLNNKIMPSKTLPMYIAALLSPADPLDPHSDLEGEAPDGSFANRNGRHAIGHVDDFSALQQQVLEGRSLVHRMETTLQACLEPSQLEDSQKQSSDLVSPKQLVINVMTEKHKYNTGVCAGPGLWMCEESTIQHQDSEADPGGGDVSAEDVLEGSSSQH